MSIALTVEFDAGEFYWVILESFDHSMVFESLVEAPDTYQTYLEALDAGYGVLKTLSDNLKRGPQQEDDICTTAVG